MLGLDFPAHCCEKSIPTKKKHQKCNFCGSPTTFNHNEKESATQMKKTHQGLPPYQNKISWARVTTFYG